MAGDSTAARVRERVHGAAAWWVWLLGLLTLGATLLLWSKGRWVLAGFIALGLVAATGWWLFVSAVRDLKALEDGHAADAAAFRLEIEPFKAPAEHAGIGFVVVGVVIRNRGARCELRPQLVYQSVKGLEQAYPDDSTLLRWPEPNEEKEQLEILTGGVARVDVAFVQTSERRVFFVGPHRLRYMALSVVSDDHRVEGLIDLEAPTLDRKQRVQFVITADPVHPVTMEATCVDHE